MSVECLDLADFLLHAEAVTGIEVEALMRLPRLHIADHALSAPISGIGETSYYPSFAEKAAAMTYQLVKGHPLIDGNKRVGYTCLLDFIRRNGYEWSRPQGDNPDRAETVSVMEGIAAGTVSQEDPGDLDRGTPRSTRDWRMTDDPTLPFDNLRSPDEGDRDDDIPLVYVASPLTRATTNTERQAITFQVDKILGTITERERDEDVPAYRTHAPAVLTAPWALTDVPDDHIYKTNTLQILTEADALVILAIDGGSAGTGQELELAARRGLPVLQVSPDGDPISRQVKGNPLVRSRSYRLPEDLAIVVREFLRDYRTRIEDGPRTRRNMSILYAALQSDLWVSWMSLTGPTERGRVAAGAGLTPTYVDHVLSHPLLVATLPTHQLVRLGDGLEVEAASYLTTAEEALTIPQLGALISAKEEFGWTDEQTEWVRSGAHRELAGGGVRRLLLNNPADWRRLMETLTREADG